MKTVNAAILGALGVLLGWAINFSVNSRTNAQHAEDVRALRSLLEQARQAEAKSVAQRDGWQAEAERLRQDGKEVHQLRAEVSRLKSETAQQKASLERRVAESGKEKSVQAPILKKSDTGPGAISLDETPPMVRASILRETGSSFAGSIFARSTDGKLTYGAKGQFQDGRGIALNISDDGTVLEKTTEVPAESVPAQVQTVAAQMFGNLAAGKPREVIEGGQVRYEFGAKGPEMSMEISVRDDGTVLGYSTRWRPPKESPVKPQGPGNPLSPRG